MEVVKNKNIIINNPGTRAFLADAFYPKSAERLPLVIFSHGYKGYKDWGAWDLFAEKIAAAGFYFVKFNFSHNGTTVENPNEFADLEAFGNNNFTKELSDYKCVIDYFLKIGEADADKVALIGHSRGGGISVIEAFENEEVKALITLAGVSHFGYRFPSGDRLEKWREEGVMYSENKRTHQQMPHYYGFYEDYKKNEARLNVQHAAQNLEKPYLILHGAADETVKEKEAELLHLWAKNSELYYVEGASHTFGASEPWESAELPKSLNEAAEKIIKFLKEKFR